MIVAGLVSAFHNLSFDQMHCLGKHRGYSEIFIVSECCQAWVGHPYFDVIDNCTDFERKVMRMVAVSV